MSVTQKRVAILGITAFILSLSQRLRRAAVVPWAGTTNSTWFAAGAWPTAVNGMFPQGGFDEAGAINNGNTVIVNSAVTGAIHRGPVSRSGDQQLRHAADQLGRHADHRCRRVRNPRPWSSARSARARSLSAAAAANPVALLTGRWRWRRHRHGQLQNGSTTTVTDAVQVGQNGRGTLNVLGAHTLNAGRLNSGVCSRGHAHRARPGRHVRPNGHGHVQRTDVAQSHHASHWRQRQLHVGRTAYSVSAAYALRGHSRRDTFGSQEQRGRVGRRQSPAKFHRRSPAFGNTWNLVNATTINGNFSTIDASAAPALPGGQAYQTRKVAGEMASFCKSGSNKCSSCRSIATRGPHA